MFQLVLTLILPYLDIEHRYKLTHVCSTFRALLLSSEWETQAMIQVIKLGFIGLRSTVNDPPFRRLKPDVLQKFEAERHKRVMEGIKTWHLAAARIMRKYKRELKTLVKKEEAYVNESWRKLRQFRRSYWTCYTLADLHQRIVALRYSAYTMRYADRTKSEVRASRLAYVTFYNRLKARVNALSSKEVLATFTTRALLSMPEKRIECVECKISPMQLELWSRGKPFADLPQAYGLLGASAEAIFSLPYECFWASDPVPQNPIKTRHRSLAHRGRKTWRRWLSKYVSEELMSVAQLHGFEHWKDDDLDDKPGNLLLVEKSSDRYSFIGKGELTVSWKTTFAGC
eukprot:Blabericola_migrator_1__641@NODE_115_length_13846_cov_473_148632_g103_i0_p6_GENE_NODE_115_length_13846_cov_473_148632_g103_i0NODE_115_length_13846_cov_473_148632_g103_i0_p6_ORF_typecomplete_len342_score38_11Fboxlike/PF12937_7/0_00051Fboxlike/PF12937_7/1_8e04Fboxlike/PF12937_7/1_8e04DUF1729/PF08354_10/2_7Fbox/PF00646_33/1_2Fbox/PF00646_33/4e03Fbox/PF00646_33/8_9e02_NODE_115_length_13846_cov_473_148632_g103_i01029611321